MKRTTVKFDLSALKRELGHTGAIRTPDRTPLPNSPTLPSSISPLDPQNGPIREQPPILFPADLNLKTLRRGEGKGNQSFPTLLGLPGADLDLCERRLGAEPTEFGV